MAKFFVGTSGWNYLHWKGPFYPPQLNQKKWLRYYAKHFNCVELNVTFYRLPPKSTFLNWHETTPKSFRFVVKGSRFITHIKKLKDVREPLNLFKDNAAGLKEKLAAFLWQFPPGLAKDARKLGSFLRLLKDMPVRQVFEFRHPSWFDSEVYELLKKNKACLCIADSESFPCVKEVTSDFIYLRFHGRGSGSYRRRQLIQWADFAKQFKNKDIFSFFNNDAYGYAVKNAVTFKELLIN